MHGTQYEGHVGNGTNFPDVSCLNTNHTEGIETKSYGTYEGQPRSDSKGEEHEIAGKES